MSKFFLYGDRFDAPSKDGSLKTYKQIISLKQTKDLMPPGSKKYGSVTTCSIPESKLIKAGVEISPGWRHVLSYWVHSRISMLLERDYDEEEWRDATTDEDERSNADQSVKSPKKSTPPKELPTPKKSTPPKESCENESTEKKSTPSDLSITDHKITIKGMFKKVTFDNLLDNLEEKRMKQIFSKFKFIPTKYTTVKKFEGGHAETKRMVLKTKDGSQFEDIVVKNVVDKDPEMILNLKREAIILSNLPEHPNVAKVLDYMFGRGKCSIVYPYSGIDLQEILEKCEENEVRIPRTKCVKILNGILNGVKFIQSHGIINRDLKTSNVVIKNIEKEDEDPQVTLIDFGMAGTRFMSTVEKGNDGYLEGYTRGNTPPEVSAGLLNGVMFSSEVWAIGIIAINLFFTGSEEPFVSNLITHDGSDKHDDTRLGELIEQFKILGTPDPDGFIWPEWIGKLPKFPKPENKKEALEKYIKSMWVFKDEDEDAMDFIDKCICIDPFERPSVDELLDHKLFKD